MTRKQREDQLVIGDSPSGMPPPNHLVPLDEYDDEELGLHLKWPLASLLHDSVDHGQELGVFVDTAKHKTGGRYEWQDHPPTWMDPHVFADMVMADERVQKILRVAMKKDDPNAWKRILGLIDDIFDSQYLPYVMKKFEKAAPLLSRWVLLCHAYRETDPGKKSKKKTRRTR